MCGRAIYLSYGFPRTHPASCLKGKYTIQPALNKLPYNATQQYANVLYMIPRIMQILLLQKRNKKMRAGRKQKGHILNLKKQNLASLDATTSQPIVMQL